jgi:hypothetical protein
LQSLWEFTIYGTVLQMTVSLQAFLMGKKKYAPNRVSSFKTKDDCQGMCEKGANESSCQQNRVTTPFLTIYLSI